MRYAVGADGKRIEAAPGLKAACPGCGSAVIPKCGKLVIWHWAHESLKDCDPWYEPMTRWHLEWQEMFPEECREVVIGCHRADVLYKGVVIEFQHSSISVDKIMERERFYKNMIWVVDASPFGHNVQFTKRMGDRAWAFRWLWGRKCWGYARKPVHLDLSCVIKRREWADRYEILKDTYQRILKESEVDTIFSLEALHYWAGELGWHEYNYPDPEYNMFVIKKLYTDGRRVAGWGKVKKKHQYYRSDVRDVLEEPNGQTIMRYQIG